MNHNALNIITKRVPPEVLDNIHSYLQNSLMEKTLREYFRYLTSKRELYRDFAYDQYVVPQCRCRYLPPNRRDCDACYAFEYTNYYDTEDYKVCIETNPQYDKIMFGGSIWKSQEWFSW